jgi:hypothetical protein
VGVDDLKADVGCIFWSLGNISVTAFGSKLSCYGRVAGSGSLVLESGSSR